MKEVQWHALPIKDVLFRCKSDSASGLSVQEAIRRQKLHGANVIVKAQKLNALRIALHQFISPMIYILIVAAAISFLLENHVDGYVISAAVLVNVLIGFFQEFRAEKALATLQKVVSFTATVIRDGKHVSIPIEQLTLGDIIELSPGTKVPADIRLCKVSDCSINEATLTGESYPVKKTASPLTQAVILQEKTNMAFLGTLVVSGNALGVVVAIGKQTELGKISGLIASTKRDETPLQKKLAQFSKTITIFILALATVMFIVGIALGYELEPMFTTSVALAVAAIPEGVVVVLTMILAIGMQRILKQKALVRKLVAAEVLGSTNVICTDKTGTLTLGDMHVVRVITDSHDALVKTSPDRSTKHPEEIFSLIRHALLASDAFLENPIDPFESWRIFGNPTDRAIVKTAAYLGLLRQQEEKTFPRIAELAFDSMRKYSLSLHKKGNAYLLIFKGAPEVILAHATRIDIHGQVHDLKKDKRDELQNVYKKLSAEGLRIISVGFRECQNSAIDLAQHKALDSIVFQGFLCLQDPLRPEVNNMIKLTHQAGMRTVMLTGDNALTARTIARAVGLPSKEENVLDGIALERMSSQQLDDTIGRIAVFARVSPRDKLRIIDAWQKKGAVVAMTGDGVNDAPALKSANIGIALGSGTDVAKETAEIILLENNFSVIVRAIEEGRVIFANIKKVILYMVSDNFTEVVMIVIALVFSLPLPMLASQILWVNLVSDVLPAIALAVEPKESDVMHEKPVPKHEPIFTRGMRKAAIAVSLATGIASFLLFYLYWKATGDLDRARAITFFAVSVDSLLYVFSVRVLHKPIWKQDLFSNRWLIGAVLLGFFIQLIAFYTPFFRSILHTSPLSLIDWLIVLMFSVIGTTILESIKGSFSKKPSYQQL